ncbi:MAG TPA: valine--tRNA ligase, partial [Candidatus Bathyarchaeota archaeon]|nr:valine--tRNA ligase [Candidatus Bathyarchaeota archaeon]HEX69116.1 valine--tRNA ligase [Candidatus Bathyarchaeota archaeon]
YGADATRQWAAAGGATGSDIPFRWPDVEYGWRFLIKLWNAARFVSLHLKDYTPTETVKLQPLDKWLLSKLEKVTDKVSKALENYQFNIAIEAAREFTWHVLCDQYIEAVKDRLYRKEVYGEEKRKAAQYTLYNALYRTLQLLAPFIPHITEEIYQAMYAEDKGYKSIHISPWPTVNKELIDEKAEKIGDKTIALIAEIRRDKAKRRLPLNTEIKRLIVYAGNEENAEEIELCRDDIVGACRAKELQIISGGGEGKAVEDFPEIKFTAEY